MNGLARLEHFVWRHYVRFERRRRLLFPSPAEMRFIEIMGGRVLRVNWIRDPRTHFPIAFVITRGKLLREQNVRREVWCVGFCMDFANDIGRAIEIDGRQYHMDIVADMDREIALTGHGWRVLRIRARDILYDPDRVKMRAERFLVN